MIANANQSVSRSSTGNTLTPIAGGLINVKSLRLVEIDKETQSLPRQRAIEKAIPLIEEKMKNPDKRFVGGIVTSVGKLSPTYTRVIKMELVTGMHEEHPQCRPIEGIPGWCIIAHECTCSK